MGILLFFILAGCSDRADVVEGSALQSDADIKMSTSADLFGKGKETTIALVVLPLKPNHDYEGYVRIRDESDKSVQKLAVKGYNVLNPVQFHVVDVTNDGKPDIILETDEHANGGLGTHVLHVYVQEQDGRFAEKPIPDDGAYDIQFTAAYIPSSHDFAVLNKEDHRSWRVQVPAEELEHLDAELLNPNKENAVQVDPISSIDAKTNKLSTKRYVWFGRLQLNGLAILETDYVFSNENWQVKQYRLQPVDNMTTLTEVN